MTIRNMEAFIRNMWDWGILKGCFGRSEKIGPTDIDGLVSHRSRRFLALETKSPKKPIEPGQAMTFNRLMDTGLFTYVFAWGRPGVPEKIIVCHDDGRVEKFVGDDANVGVLRDISKTWWDNQDVLARNMPYRDDVKEFYRRIGEDAPHEY